MGGKPGGKRQRFSGGSPRALGEQPTRLRILRGESPLPSMARFGRRAYPGHAEVTNRERLGWKRHGCPGYVVSCGRSDLSGKQTCGLEHERMTAAPKFAAVLKSLHGRCAKRRPGPHVGKAEVLWEETGTCTTRAAGVGVQARRQRCAERTSGRSHSQQRLTATCKDRVTEAYRPRQTEGVGLAHTPVGAMREG